jgi:hypothetical protein
MVDYGIAGPNVEISDTEETLQTGTLNQDPLETRGSGTAAHDGEEMPPAVAKLKNLPESAKMIRVIPLAKETGRILIGSTTWRVAVKAAMGVQATRRKKEESRVAIS